MSVLFMSMAMILVSSNKKKIHGNDLGKSMQRLSVLHFLIQVDIGASSGVSSL